MSALVVATVAAIFAASLPFLWTPPRRPLSPRRDRLSYLLRGQEQEHQERQGRERDDSEAISTLESSQAKAVLFFRAVGFSLGPAEALRWLKRLRWAAALFVLAVVSGLGLPPTVAVVLAAIGWSAPMQIANGRWNAMRLRVEDMLPQIFSDTAGMIQINPDPTSILTRLEAALRTTGQTFLADEFRTAIMDVRRFGARGWIIAERRALRISSSLAVFYLMLRRLRETGSAEFARAFRLAAQNITENIAARQIIRAKADSARGTMRIIAGVFVFTFVQMFLDPVMRAAYTTATGQIITAGAFAVMAFGWWYVHRQIAEVMG